MSEVVIRSLSEQDTRETGRKLGMLLCEGDSVYLSGGLGAGKTVFAGGIGKALGISGYMTSPTFTLINMYGNENMLVHADAYRINDACDINSTGLQDYFDGKHIIILEWAELVKSELPGCTVSVDIRNDCSEDINTRIIRILFTDPEDKRTGEIC